MKHPKLKVWQSDVDGQWYWKLVAKNGKTQCLSEAYPTKYNAVRGAEAARRTFYWAEVVVG